jgi:hypothetical protein
MIRTQFGHSLVTAKHKEDIMIDEERRELQLRMQKTDQFYQKNMAKFNQLEKDYREKNKGLEQTILDLTLRYQQEVGEPRRCLMQAGEMMKALKWQEVKEPPELVELYATLDHAIRSICRNQVPPHV